MSQLPLTRIANATVVPSGDNVGEVSTPAASVTGVNFCHGRSTAAGAGFENHTAPANAGAPMAMLQGSHAIRPTLRGGGRATPESIRVAVDAVDIVDSVSRAKARLLAD